MAIENKKVKSLYDALKSDGAMVGTEDNFNEWFFKPGEEGYKNRKRLWETFKAGGAEVGANYEEFRDWLGLSAVNSSQSIEDNSEKMAGGKRTILGRVRTRENRSQSPELDKMLTSGSHRPTTPTHESLIYMEENRSGLGPVAKREEKRLPGWDEGEASLGLRGLDDDLREKQEGAAGIAGRSPHVYALGSSESGA